MESCRKSVEICVAAGVKLPRIFFSPDPNSIEEFSYLIRDYGDDGMLHYAMAEAYEYQKDIHNALNHYQKAKDLFPVEHWKAVADSTIKRIQTHKTAEQFFDSDNFEELLWQGFQKTYEFIL